MDNNNTFQQFAYILSKLQNNSELENIVQQAQAIASKFTSEQEALFKGSEQQFSDYVQEEIQKMGQDVLSLVQVQPKKVKRLYVDGVFDLMHSGHYNALRQAKQLCETLVVGVVSHEQVCLRKGTPILDVEERIELASSCKFVDEIQTNVPYDSTMELLDQFNCSHLAHGDDLILTSDGKDAYQPFKDAGRMLIFKRTEGISTTDIVGRLLLMSKSYQEATINKRFRKQSGDQGVQASKLDSDSDIEQQQQQQASSQPMVVNKVKMLNTTRRIRQFSADHKEPLPGQKIVYIDGSYDLMHIGHIRTLKKAKSMGDYLIVGVHDDDTINEQKGENYPILHLQERVLNVLAMKYVDEVIIGAPWKITEQMVKQFGINLVVEGSLTKLKEHSQQQLDDVNDPYQVPKRLGIYEQIESESKMTTETIIERIVNNRLQYMEIYNKKATKEKNYYENNERKVQES